MENNINNNDLPLDEYIQHTKDILEGVEIDLFEEETHRQELIDYFQQYRVDDIDIYTPNGNLLIDALVQSNNKSTHNLGLLLSFLYKNHTWLYNENFDDILISLDQKNQKTLFSGQPIDDYKLESNSLVLNYLLSKSETRQLGKQLFDSIIHGDPGNKIEFNSLIIFLLKHVDLPGQERLKDVIVFMRDLFEKNPNPFIVDDLRKLVIMVSKGLSIQTARGTANYDFDEKRISIDDYCCSSVVAMHELGHAIDDFFSKRDKRQFPMDKYKVAIEHIRNNPDILDKIKLLNSKLLKISKDLEQEYDQKMIQLYGSKEKALEFFKNYAIEQERNGTLETLFDRYNCNPATIRTIKNNISVWIDYNKVANALYDQDKQNYVDRVLLNTKEFEVIDIITAIFRGKNLLLPNRDIIRLDFGHDRFYYKQGTSYSMEEIYANLNSLLAHGDQELIDLLREIIGDEFFEYIMEDRTEGMLFEEGLSPDRKKAI